MWLEERIKASIARRETPEGADSGWPWQVWQLFSKWFDLILLQLTVVVNMLSIIENLSHLSRVKTNNNHCTESLYVFQKPVTLVTPVTASIKSGLKTGSLEWSRCLLFRNSMFAFLPTKLLPTVNQPLSTLIGSLILSNTVCLGVREFLIQNIEVKIRMRGIYFRILIKNSGKIRGYRFVRYLHSAHK